MMPLGPADLPAGESKHLAMSGGHIYIPGSQTATPEIKHS
jgi:hypothetical protein